MSEGLLNFQLEELEDDTFAIQLYDILRQVLQPDATLYIEDATSQITAILPEKTPDASDIGEFFCICDDVAEQIPFEHPSVTKLVNLVDLCINTPKPANADGSIPSQTDVKERYGKLGETLRDKSNVVDADRNPTKYLNFHGFVIRLDDYIQEKRSVLPVLVLHDAFENPEAYIKTMAGRDACVKAALRYLVHRSDAIYQEINEDGKQEKWRIWHQQVQAIALRDNSASDETKGLRHWLGLFRIKADANATSKEESRSYSSDLVSLAAEALVAMEAIDPCKPVKVK